MKQNLNTNIMKIIYNRNDESLSKSKALKEFVLSPKFLICLLILDIIQYVFTIVTVINHLLFTTVFRNLCSGVLRWI